MNYTNDKDLLFRFLFNKSMCSSMNRQIVIGTSVTLLIRPRVALSPTITITYPNLV
ncbi:hypothetical protein HanPSC8_Chr07g0294121 [Helianthus annuus]|nr:hypothetical protein HanPSC8_Chr07g0294121 [Helianthus annuus]